MRSFLGRLGLAGGHDLGDALGRGARIAARQWPSPGSHEVRRRGGFPSTRAHGSAAASVASAPGAPAGSADDEAAAQGAYEANWSDAMRRCLDTPSATISHHHGVGRVRAPWIREELGGWWPVWQAIRSAVDPEGILNPNAVGGWPQSRSAPL